MKIRTIATATVFVLGASAALAQGTADTTQRDLNQQNRIEQGLKSGSLTTKEAGRLEREESKIDRLQARDLKNGNLSPQERARLQQAQNRASHDIKAAENNGAKGNPQSASSERMQADVQRNANQEQRIEQGVKSGSLTNREAAALEHGQARVDHAEAHAAKDGHVGEHEQDHIQHTENKQSQTIHAEKHNARHRKG
jgi:hypothetical protein